MLSGGLVFKSSVLTEFWSHWLKPYVHYIPVEIDLSDLEQKVRWAIENDEKAREIMENGRRFVYEYLRDEQQECYLELLLLEISRLSTGNSL